MSKERSGLQLSPVSSRSNSRSPNPVDLNDVEMVFGTPASPKNNVKPAVHIANERNKSANEHKVSDVDNIQPTQPLLEPEMDKQKPPLAGPEIDDIGDEKPHDATPYPGIDDGLLDPENKIDKPELPEGEERKSTDGEGHESGPELHDDGTATDEDGLDVLHNRFGEDRPGSPMPLPGTIPDVNTYQQKKNLAQGMMDLALLSANANQLRYVLESSQQHPYFYPSLTFIALSIIFQIAVGVGLIMNSRYNVKDEKDICKADKINNMTVLGIFLITIVNVFITSFSVATPNVSSVVQQGG